MRLCLKVYKDRNNLNEEDNCRWNLRVPLIRYAFFESGSEVIK